MLTYAAPKGILQWAQIYKLYQKAFPASEKKPFSMIRRMAKQGRTDIWRFARDGRFAGLVMTINGAEHILIDYLAVDEAQRGGGIGSQILQAMKAHYADKGIFLEIESVYEESENQAQRVRRKHFYEKCGMESMGLFVWLFGVKMELMSFGCKLTYAQYHDFHRDNYSQWAADHIQSAEAGPEGRRP